MLRMCRLGVASCAIGHDAAWPRGVRQRLSGCPECSFTGQRELIGREPDAQTNPVGDLHNKPLRTIGVDEVSYGRGKRKYLTIVWDHDRARVVVIGQGRERDTLDAFFAKLGPRRSRRIRVVTMDMWQGYIGSVQAHAPLGIHVRAHASVSEQRRRIMRQVSTRVLSESIRRRCCAGFLMGQSDLIACSSQARPIGGIEWE